MKETKKKKQKTLKKIYKNRFFLRIKIGIDWIVRMNQQSMPWIEVNCIICEYLF